MSDEKLGVQMYTTGLGDLISDWSDSRSPDPEDDAVNALLLEISEQENQMPDDLPSGITAADVGHASLPIPIFNFEEDYPGPNVIESHQEEAEVVERLFIELIEDAEAEEAGDADPVPDPEDDALNALVSMYAYLAQLLSRV